MIEYFYLFIPHIINNNYNMLKIKLYKGYVANVISLCYNKFEIYEKSLPVYMDKDITIDEYLNWFKNEFNVKFVEELRDENCNEYDELPSIPDDVFENIQRF